MKSVITSLSIACALAILLAGISLMLPHASAATSQDQMTVIFPPMVDHTQAIQMIISADGKPVRTGLFDFIIIAQSNSENFTNHVKSNGALTAFSSRIMGGCFVQNGFSIQTPDWRT